MERLAILFGSPQERFIGFALIIAFILPHTSMGLMMINPLLAFILLMYNKHSLDNNAIPPITAIFISLILGVVSGVEGKAVFTALSVMFLIFAFPLFRNKSIKDVYIYIIFGILFFSQISYIFHIGIITSLIDKLYPISWNSEGIENMINSVGTDNYSSFRLGGLYRNPNHLAKYVTFLMAFYAAKNINKPFKKGLPFLIICFLSILLTGSRTGFLIGIVIISLFSYKNQSIGVSFKLIISTAVVAGILYFVLVGSGTSFRGVNIEQGMHDSAGLKYALTVKYITEQATDFQMLFGNLDLSLFKSPYTYSLDCEYGYVIYCYGLMGLFAMIFYLFSIYRSIEKHQRIFFIILLWMITSSIFMSYRAVFIFILLMSGLSISHNKLANHVR